MRSPEPPPLGPGARAIIDAAREGHDPSELNRARVRRGVELKVAAGVGLALGPASTALAGAAMKVTLAAAAVGTVVGAGIYVLPRHAETTTRAPAAIVARHRAPAPAPAPVEVPAPIVVAPTAAPRRRAHTAPVVTDHVSALAEETALLGAANGALARRDLATATALLDDYDHRGGAGILAEERTVTGVLILCATGKPDAAQVEARRFRARWPRSPLAARIDGSCVGPAHPNRPVP